MFGIAVALAMGSYWLFHWGYYFAKGAPVSMLDDLLPSRRATFLAGIDYMRKAGPFTPPGGNSPQTAPVPGANAAPAGTAPQIGGEIPAGQR